MNGTCWTTLSAFVQTLASNGIVEAEETERVRFRLGGSWIGMVYYLYTARRIGKEEARA